jgi:hypothetical protein
MTKKFNEVIFWVGVLIAAVFLTYGWFNSPLSVPLSEYIWSTYNQLFDGRNPGLASDLEFLTVFIFWVGIGYVIAYFLKSVLTSRRRT